MVYRAACGSAESQLGPRLKRAGSLSGLCVETGNALRCDNAETDTRVDREACRRVGLLSMLVAPLTHHDTVVGALKVISRHVNAFGDDDLEILELMSELIAAAMFHAAQYIESPFQFERHKLTLAASIGLSAFPDDGEEIDVLLEKADQSMYAEKRLRKQR